MHTKIPVCTYKTHTHTDSLTSSFRCFPFCQTENMAIIMCSKCSSPYWSCKSNIFFIRLNQNPFSKFVLVFCFFNMVPDMQDFQGVCVCAVKRWRLSPDNISGAELKCHHEEVVFHSRRLRHSHTGSQEVVGKFLPPALAWQSSEARGARCTTLAVQSQGWAINIHVSDLVYCVWPFSHIKIGRNELENLFLYRKIYLWNTNTFD